MTFPSPATQNGDTDARRVMTFSLGVTVMLVALKAFAMGGSGSVSALATLTESALDLANLGFGLFAVRWATAHPGPEGGAPGPQVETSASLVQVGLILASAVFIGLIAVLGILDPRPGGGGAWAVGAVGVSILLTGGLIVWQNRMIAHTASVERKTDRARSFADLGSGIVALIGIASGAWLKAPGLDAAAGLVISVWLFWGGLALLKTTVSPAPVASSPVQ